MEEGEVKWQQECRVSEERGRMRIDLFFFITSKATPYRWVSYFYVFGCLLCAIYYVVTLQWQTLVCLFCEQIERHTPYILFSHYVVAQNLTMRAIRAQVTCRVPSLARLCAYSTRSKGEASRGSRVPT